MFFALLRLMRTMLVATRPPNRRNPNTAATEIAPTADAVDLLDHGGGASRIPTHNS